MSGGAAANDNAIAHRLYLEKQHARSAEIFTDPAWKGVALYRSSQWWRAAEAFVRANDADSQYNLGNSYVKLGYYALALDAYNNALTIEPDMPDAAHNAEIMKKLLALENDEQQGTGALQPKEQEIDQLETENEEGEQGGTSLDDEQSDTGDSAPGTSPEATMAQSASDQPPQEGEGGDATEEQQAEREGDPGSSDIKGSAEEGEAENRPSGGSESDVASNDSQASGSRSELEKQQATEQWLNQINHDPYRFLQSRIKLELKRRKASGQSAPDGGSVW